MNRSSASLLCNRVLKINVGFLLSDGPGNQKTINVEIDEQFWSDEIKVLEGLKNTIQHNINSTLGLSAKINLVEPMSIPRSEGKAKRIIDNRKK